ncbi:MAG: insulinase family protein [Bacteroidales bacterium]|nr:insulinase family protein [Bacteroidales bacterium]
MNTEKYQYYRLSNGIKLIQKEASSHVTHVGLVVNTGTRDELPSENGIAHFIEHLIFKSTHKRNTYQVLSYLENVGGDLNAYTTKEETFFYASVPNPYFDRALDILSDIVFNAAFQEKDMETEKEVVIEEINSYKDNPAELIFDAFENQIFAGHPLGTYILGTKKSVRGFKREDILRFMERTYHTDQMVIAIVGAIPFKRSIQLAERYFGQIPARLRQEARQPFQRYTPSHCRKNIRGNQTHLMMGCVLPRYNDDKHLTATLLNNLLGGPGMGTRLNLSLREKRGYVYSVESAYAALSDTGMFTIYAGMDTRNTEKCKELIVKELRKLRSVPLGSLQLLRAKRQFIGQTCISNESNLTEMLSIGKNHLLFDEVESIPEMIARTERITAADLTEMANEMLPEEKLSSLLFL